MKYPAQAMLREMSDRLYRLGARIVDYKITDMGDRGEKAQFAVTIKDPSLKPDLMKKRLYIVGRGYGGRLLREQGYYPNYVFEWMVPKGG